MSKKIDRVARAKQFVDTYLAELDDWWEDEKYSESEISNYEFDFSNPQRYFVKTSSERCGCYGAEAIFMAKKDVIDLLEYQLEPDDYRYVKDSIIIFDTTLNKVVKPKIVLE